MQMQMQGQAIDDLREGREDVDLEGSWSHQLLSSSWISPLCHAHLDLFRGIVRPRMRTDYPLCFPLQYIDSSLDVG